MAAVSFRLIVDELELTDEADSNYHAIIGISKVKMDEMQFVEHEVVQLMGKKNKPSVSVVVVDDSCPNGKVRMHRILRNNIRVRLGDVINITAFKNIPIAQSVQIAPVADTIDCLTGNLLNAFLRPYFSDRRYRLPIHKGDVFTVSSAMRTVAFKVIGMSPSPACVVNSAAVIQVSKAVKCEKEELVLLQGISYNDIGGVDAQLTDIREVFELPMRQPKLVKIMGIKPTRGVLLIGPPGSGKKLIARAVASEIGVPFHGICARSWLSKESEANLRKVFAECEYKLPALLFIDDIDLIAPKQKTTDCDLERRVASELLKLLDKRNDDLFVIAATSRPNDIDVQLRCAGRLDRHVTISSPDAVGRMEILRIHTKKMTLAGNGEFLQQIANESVGFVGADLASLCSKAALMQVREHVALVEFEGTIIDAECLKALAVSKETFNTVLVQMLKDKAQEEQEETVWRPALFGDAIAIGDLVKSTLGTTAMYKTLISDEQYHTTNDGMMILQSIRVDNFAAEVLIDKSKTPVGSETSVVVLATEMLKEADKLVGMRIHPQRIIAGWEKASTIAKDALLQAATKLNANSANPMMPGGGASEMQMALAMEEEARKTTGKESIAIEAFARALAQLPTIISNNAGFDGVGLVAQLRAAHTNGKVIMGLDYDNGEVVDMVARNMTEMINNKVELVSSAAAAAIEILRVDGNIQCAQ